MVAAASKIAANPKKASAKPATFFQTGSFAKSTNPTTTVAIPPQKHRHRAMPLIYKNPLTAHPRPAGSFSGPTLDTRPAPLRRSPRRDQIG